MFSISTRKWFGEFNLTILGILFNKQFGKNDLKSNLMEK